jgi:transcriptional regulator with XRE-family HTH domain
MLRHARLQQGITLRELGEDVSLSISYLAKMERGDVLPPPEERINALEHALKLPHGQLLALAERLPEDIYVALLNPEKRTIIRKYMVDQGLLSA